ncbi:MAG TPA: hypothetical protein VIL32_16340 [Steroidobacteraceae bacterium]
MPFGRGFAAVALLILIALACLAVARRLDRERRLLARLRGGSISPDDLTEDERDTADHLASVGVLRLARRQWQIDPSAFAAFRRKRLRLALFAALAALTLAAIVILGVLFR